MAKLWISGSGSAGSGSDECTASKAEVLKGFSAITSDSDDEAVQGTLELTADAADGQVLSGKTYYNTNPKSKRTGSMTNQGAVSIKLNAGEGYTVPSGFHNGGGKVEANSLASQTGGTATAAHILNGQTAWVNGSKITGNITSMGGQNVNPGASQQVVSSSGKYMTGNVVINGVVNLSAGNIKKGVNVGGVTGTWEGYVPTSNDLYLRGNNIAGLALVSGYSWTSGTTLESGGMWLQRGYVSLITNSLDVTPYNYLNVELLYQSHEYSGKSGFSGGRLWLALVRHTGSNSPAESNVLVSQDIGFVSGVLSLPLANLSLTSKFFIMFGLRGNYSDDGSYANHNAFSNMGGVNGWIYRIWLS